MPDRATLITALILERPMCVLCLASRVPTTPVDVEVALVQIERVLTLTRENGRCRVCGSHTLTLTLRRPDFC
jgi:hypothetical protein